MKLSPWKQRLPRRHLFNAHNTMTSKNHLRVLKVLAEYRILSSSQISRLLFKSDQMARRVLREMEQRQWIIPIALASQGKKGRPQKVYHPSDSGLNQIQGVERAQPSPVSNQIPHQIAVNWLRIYAQELETIIPEISVTTLAPNSLIQKKHLLSLKVNESTRLTSDAVLTIEHPSTNRKLLFFIEMDMGSESQKSRSGHTNNLEHKIISYATCMAEEKHRHLNQPFNAQFKGYRVLLVANTQARLDQINLLLTSLPNCDFIWTSILETIQTQTMAAAIWNSNGTPPLLSILGKLAPKP